MDTWFDEQRMSKSELRMRPLIWTIAVRPGHTGFFPTLRIIWICWHKERSWSEWVEALFDLNLQAGCSEPSQLSMAGLGHHCSAWLVCTVIIQHGCSGPSLLSMADQSLHCSTSLVWTFTVHHGWSGLTLLRTASLDLHLSIWLVRTITIQYLCYGHSMLCMADQKLHCSVSLV